ncbi:MAG: fructose-1,6-bisphosphatase/inositol monophosphatase family enzyme, partial [Pseudohongiellaceae bacterium]
MTRLDADVLQPLVRTFHEDIRRRVAAVLHEARVQRRPELASRPGEWGAGDLGYALDEAAEQAIVDFGEALGRHGPAVVVAEGPGEHRYGAAATATSASDAPPVLALVDPVDGTRPLMQELRSAWVLTGLAPDRGPATRLADIEVAVQTELPLSTAAIYHVLTARRGQGATIARHDVRTGECLQTEPLQVQEHQPLDNGTFSFTRYLPVERTLVADLERRFLERAIATHELNPRLIYDDQYLCSAGQLFLVTTGRYRMLADLRGWLRAKYNIANFTAKPYDLAALLIYQEAGVRVLDATGKPLDAPCDTETPLDVLAFGNDILWQAYWGLLESVLSSAADA